MGGARTPVICLIFIAIPALAAAGPAFPELTGAEPAWEEGPEGAFRPLAGGVSGRDWVVDGAAGDDGNAGTADAPLATIQRALERVAAGDRIVVRAGVYHEQVAPPELATPASRASPVLLLADPPDGESVVIDGEGVVAELEGNLDAPAGISLVRDSGFQVEGFAVRNWAGYGLAVVNGSDVQVRGCGFADNGGEMADSVDVVLLGSRAARVIGNTFDSATERGLDDRGIDSWIAHNRFSGHTTSAIKIGPAPAGRGSRVLHNRFFDNPATQGVILAREVEGVTVQRNLLVGGSLVGITVDTAADSRFFCNTVVGFHAGLQLRDLTGCRVEGQVLAGNTLGIEFLSQLMFGTTVDGNLYHDNTAAADGGDPGPNAVFGDPAFVDAAAGDYRLAAGSAALDAGPPDLPLPVGGGASADAGAFERGAGEPPYHYAPAATVADRSPAFAWLFIHADAAAEQAGYRVQLDRRPDFDSPDLLDSNWRSGDDARWIVPSAFALEADRWYVRVKTRDDAGREGPWSDAHRAYQVGPAPACAEQAGVACLPLDACSDDWLPAADTPRCCSGECVACADDDGDGFQDEQCGGADCDDGDAAVNPQAEEQCDNGIDDDCDGDTDLGDGDCGCVDHDQDGYGQNCEAGADCDDTIASVHPGAEEECNYVDDDCDGETDEGFDTDRDPDNCGECFNACRADEVCDRGSCADACGGGRSNCDRSCIDTDSDVDNCGGCGRVCALDHAGQRCSEGQCVLTACESGWVDADGDASNGCEYACTISGDGSEVCDNGVDDDCDGQTDEDCDGGGGGCATTPGAAPAALVLLLLLPLALRRSSTPK
jgi:hypothetical protein